MKEIMVIIMIVFKDSLHKVIMVFYRHEIINYLNKKILKNSYNLNENYLSIIFYYS